MLHITDTFFPSLGMIAKVAVPIGTFFVLGIIAFLIQTVLGSALQKIHVLDDVRMLFHIVFLILILAETYIPEIKSLESAGLILA